MNHPGSWLRAIAARWCTEQTLERIVDPAIADVQTEYADALRAGRVWQSRWILMAGYVAFAKAIVCHGAQQAIGSVRGASADDRRALARTMWIGLAAMAGGILLLALLPFVSVVAGTAAERLRLTLYAVPQLLPTSIFIGITYGILLGLEDRTVSRKAGGLVMLLALAASVVSFALMGWIIPGRDQAFRVAVAATLGVEPPARSANELTLGELGRLLEPGTHEPMLLARPHNIRSVELSYYTRWALSLGPFVLALFALTLNGRTRFAHRAPGFVASTIVFGYIVLWFVAQFVTIDRRVPVAAAVWIPNAVFLLMCAAALRTSTGARSQAPR
jgi:hypothetical protein